MAPDTALHHAWPSGLDWIALASFLVLMVVLPVVGMVLLCVDLRRWQRSLRRALVIVLDYLPQLPAWARPDTPRCVKALGLSMPCTVLEVKQAYREKVMASHPDHGGDKRRFLWLQSQFEQALALVESLEQSGVASE